MVGMLHLPQEKDRFLLCDLPRFYWYQGGTPSALCEDGER